MWTSLKLGRLLCKRNAFCKLQKECLGFEANHVFFSSTPVVNAQQKIDILNLQINYEKVGNGPNKVLCLPGALGTIGTDFQPQLDNLNPDKFTIVCWDPPGYGKSRPPNRDVRNPPKTLSNDAILANQLMQKLGFEKYSLLGWSDGSITSLFLASTFPNSVRKMIIWGGNAFVSKGDRDNCIKFGSVDSLSEKMKKPMIDAYGEEYFRKTWADWMNAFVKLFPENGGNLCIERLPLIKCPTFIIHGAKDAMVEVDHAKFLNAHIKNSKLLVMPEGNHNLHLRYATEFNLLAEEFLLEGTTS